MQQSGRGGSQGPHRIGQQQKGKTKLLAGRSLRPASRCTQRPEQSPHPCLFLGSDCARATNALAVATPAAIAQKPERGSNVSLSLVKTDSSALAEWRGKKGGEANGVSEKKMLKPTLSKIAVTSLGFSVALPVSAFASLLVETVARLDMVIEEVEELGRVAGFKEYQGKPQVEIQVSTPSVAHGNNHLFSHGVD